MGKFIKQPFPQEYQMNNHMITVEALKVQAQNEARGAWARNTNYDQLTNREANWRAKGFRTGHSYSVLYCYVCLPTVILHDYTNHLYKILLAVWLVFEGGLLKLDATVHLCGSSRLPVDQLFTVVLSFSKFETERKKIVLNIQSWIYRISLNYVLSFYGNNIAAQWICFCHHQAGVITLALVFVWVVLTALAVCEWVTLASLGCTEAVPHHIVVHMFRKETNHQTKDISYVWPSLQSKYTDLWIEKKIIYVTEHCNIKKVFYNCVMMHELLSLKPGWTATLSMKYDVS